MIVPGTTVAVSLLPGCVELRDKGVVQKKIKVKSKSFDEVAQEVELYFRQKGKRLAPSTIRDTLIRIGLPQVRVILVENAPPEPERTEVITKPTSSAETGASGAMSTPATESPPAGGVLEAADRLASSETSTDLDEPPAQLKPETVVHGGVSLEAHDFQDIETALSAVEHLSDSFMAAGREESAGTVGRIGIKLKGADEVIASSKTHSATQSVPTNAVAQEPITDSPSGPAIAKVEATPSVAEAAPKGTDVAGPVVSKTAKTPAHVVKPLVKAKALILGEDTVGKHSLLAKAGLAPLEDTPYLFTKVFELEDYRVNLSVWCFDDAVKAKVSRKEFYRESDVVLIVYSASDRWSYESLEFWLKEASLALPRMPPVVIVANKKDQRMAGCSGERQPVGTEEGFAYAEALAAKLGVDDHLHPVAFIETSCLTSEGVVDLFRTAAELYVGKVMQS